MQYSLEHFFSEDAILKVLCHTRAKMAKQRHDLHFLDNISENSRLKNLSENYKLFPPRRKWVRLSRKDRTEKLISSVEINEKQLIYTVKKYKRKFKNKPESKPEWLAKLEETIRKVQYSALYSSNFELSNPTILPSPKDISKNQYRPIAQYNFTDQIIIKQLSKYLTYQFDLYFTKNAYAFRKNKLHQNTGKIFNHHEAVIDILEYWKGHKHKPLYIAESDLQKFYDTINHSIIIEKLKEIQKENTHTIDIRAERLFHSYLKSYSFNKYVQNRSLHNYDPKVTFPWPQEQLTKYYKLIENENIGIPQGGAISVFIANLVLHSADMEVLQFNKFSPIFYARFCDDIILLHKWKWRTSFALWRYNNAIKKLKLVIHEPEKIKKYTKDFWNAKSKSPYKWGEPMKSGFPWLSFVGYQIHFTGNVKIRLNSFKKEKDKIINETTRLLKHINRKSKQIRLSQSSILYRFQQKLISMSVGRIDIMSGENSNHFSWSGGFKVLKLPEIKIFVLQLKNLDRTRNKCISIIKNKIAHIEKEKSTKKNKHKPLKFYGKPFSYFGQFEKSETADNSD
ncbi:hypothetical protein EHQ26_08740 [Leptospira bourretii]|uniref:Reverse transcriptase domain-containing protein n=2 Tax=Leptospira bourretii TaxID=2484962 RepID=A0ABY2LG48_9LEPT|nr:reverse transcriptase domain-containing protein [Leptospira bourretii]TGK92480.1 hypothetical protein EHQ26_08740 [Leptospira bourretii]